MSLDSSTLTRRSSPANSDSSLHRFRAQEKQEPLEKDKNYRRYAATVERALSLFDTVLQEWADYISFLSRLLKALQSHPPELPIVPHKVVVAKRLAQCLNPSLPSGVHQKSLEVYAYIFSFIRPEGLARDLSLYLPGIAPTLTFASLSVRPLFLSLVETYLPEIEPLALRPALKAILLALLPGLEEETNEDFEQTLRVINKFRNVSSLMDIPRRNGDPDVRGQYFWQCLFLASITNPSRRLGVLAYLTRHLPQLSMVDHKVACSKKEGIQATRQDLLAVASSVISPEPGLLIRCFATGLCDEQFLVQRNFLDLLVTHLPLHSPILQSKIREDDFVKLVIAAVGVVTRRDMSLNRRLWTWLLSPETTAGSNERPSVEFPDSPSGGSISISSDNHEHTQSQYFNRFGFAPLVRGLLNMINEGSTTPSERTRPIRISLSLMDRWEIGGFVMPVVFIPIVRSVQAFEQVASKSQFDEVFRSASAFFDGVEGSLIFSELLHLMDVPLDDSNAKLNEVLDNLKLACFILTHFHVQEEEMLLIHIPLLTLFLLVKTGDLQSKSEASLLNLDDIKRVAQHLMRLANQLVSLLSEKAFLRKAISGGSIPGQSSLMGSTDILRYIHGFYNRGKLSYDLPPLPFSPKALGELILRESHHVAVSALKGHDGIFSIKETSNVLVTLVKKAHKLQSSDNNVLYAAFRDRLEAGDAEFTTSTFSTVSSVTFAAVTLHSLHVPGYHVTYKELSNLIPVLVRQLWDFLSPLSPKFHVEAVHCLWLLHSVSWADHLVEASISSLMIVPGSPVSAHVSNIEQAERFFVLWNHSHHWIYETQALHVDDEQGSNKKTAVQDRSLYQSSMLERPVFIVLDLLSPDSNETPHRVQAWLEDLPSVNRLFYIVVSKLEALLIRDSESCQDQKYSSASILEDNFRECHYLFRTISRILPSLSQNGWVTLVSHPVSQIDKSQDSIQASENGSHRKSYQTAIVEAILAVLDQGSQPHKDISPEEVELQQISLQVLRQLTLGLGGERIVKSDIYLTLIDWLSVVLDQGNTLVQGAIIDTLLSVLKTRFFQILEPPSSSKHRGASSRDTIMSTPLLSISTEKVDKVQQTPALPLPPSQLLDCLLKGISSPHSRALLDKWIILLCDCLPIYAGGIFQVLLRLVECFCKEIQSSYRDLRLVFTKTEKWAKDRTEYVTIALLTGLETCIATAHERLRLEETNAPLSRSPDQPQGFFGNMVSGVFTTEGSHGRNTANNRLTVLLCFQDAVRLCFSIWSWGSIGKNGSSLDTESTASFQYTSLRMRNRSRRILEHLFAAEALECLETLVELWSKSGTLETGTGTHILNLLHTLDGARPKITVPALFNAIYSRTNPMALDPGRKSAMTSSLTGTELTAFLVAYTRSLDDDVLDEIWPDCTTFLRDVLSNPFPHRQILPRLVEFAAILGIKMENTTFGDDRRMRKELGDVLLRTLTAIFTSKPPGLSQDPSLSARSSLDHEVPLVPHIGPDDMPGILATSLPAFIAILNESDRISAVMTNISTNLIGPTIRSRLFPNNVNKNILLLLQQIAKIPAASKMWKRDIGEAFNDVRFFSSQIDLVKAGWMSLLRQWVLVDKDRLSELLMRLTQPTSAGIMFGVGASSARFEADRKTQLNLRRIALLVLSADEDYFIGELPNIIQKLEDLQTATSVSSPSSATRAEVFMALRSLVLKISTTHSALLWPLINSELQEAISAISRGQPSELHTPHSLLQACKLLDMLLVMSPDDFQLHEWVFTTDTTDAVYPPGGWEPVALADEVSRNLGPADAVSPGGGDMSDDACGLKRPWLISDRTRETAKDEITDRILRPFFDRLSIRAFENMYSLRAPDLATCRDDLLADLFNESTMAN